MTLADRLRANAALLEQMLREPGVRIAKADLAGLVSDLRRQAGEAEELAAMAGARP